MELSIITVAYIITMGIMKRNFKTRKNEEKTRIANSCCFGGKALGGYIAVRQRIMIHGEQIITTGVMATILIVIAYQFFRCHYWFGHMLLVALYGFNTYSLLTHGIVYIVTAICIFTIILTIPINLSDFIGSEITN